MARRNDAPWREECIAKRGNTCRCCKMTGVQMDHLVPRAHGGQSVVENGLPLCRRCHQAKTEHRLLIRPEWLDPDQVEWLQAHGYAWWDEQGEVYGTRRRIFNRRTT